jgi:plastocyanin
MSVRREALYRRTSFVFIVVAATALVGCGASATPSPAPVSPAASVPAASTGASAPAASTGASASAGGQASAPAVACQTSTDAGTVTASIANFKFSPEPIQAKVGDVVAWTNNDSTTHTVTLDDGSCDAGHAAPGSTVALTFGKAGTYAYHCAIHSSMKGTVQVSA